MKKKYYTSFESRPAVLPMCTTVLYYFTNMFVINNGKYNG